MSNPTVVNPAPLPQDEALALLREIGVLREGHFLLTSGRHSPQFLLLSQLTQYPAHTERFCRALAGLWSDVGPFDTVIGPAMGGVILAYETARAFAALNPDRAPRALFAEKVEGGMALKRGYSLKPGERVLAVEDAVTTGGSVSRVLELVRAAGAELAGVGALVDRSGGKAGFGVPFRAVLTLNVPSYDAAGCPLCAAGQPLTKPKS